MTFFSFVFLPCERALRPFPGFGEHWRDRGLKYNSGNHWPGEKLEQGSRCVFTLLFKQITFVPDLFFLFPGDKNANYRSNCVHHLLVTTTDTFILGTLPFSKAGKCLFSHREFLRVDNIKEYILLSISCRSHQGMLIRPIPFSNNEQISLFFF